jgi:hypothetical protein
VCDKNISSGEEDGPVVLYAMFIHKYSLHIFQICYVHFRFVHTVSGTNISFEYRTRSFYLFIYSFIHSFILSFTYLRFDDEIIFH